MGLPPAPTRGLTSPVLDAAIEAAQTQSRRRLPGHRGRDRRHPHRGQGHGAHLAWAARPEAR